MLDRVLLIIREDDHVFPLVTVPLDEEGRDIVHIIDTSTQLSILSKIVDTDQQSLSFTSTIGVLKRVATGSSMAKLLSSLWRRWATPSMGSVASTLHWISVRIEVLRRSTRGWT